VTASVLTSAVAIWSPPFLPSPSRICVWFVCCAVHTITCARCCAALPGGGSNPALLVMRQERAGKSAGPRIRPIPFDTEAARTYGRVCAAVIDAGRKPRRRVTDLMIIAIAIAEELPLFTANPDHYKGLDGLLTVVPVTRHPSPGPPSRTTGKAWPPHHFRTVGSGMERSTTVTSGTGPGGT